MLPFSVHVRTSPMIVREASLIRNSVAMKTRRPNLLSWNPWMSRCTLHLQRSPHIRDKQMAVWFELQRLVDEVMTSFGLEDTSVANPLSDMRILTILRWFDDRMQSWKKDISPEMLHGRAPFPCAQIIDGSILIHEMVSSDGVRVPLYQAGHI